MPKKHILVYEMNKICNICPNHTTRTHPTCIIQQSNVLRKNASMTALDP